ncbi:hypothetical protein EXT46_08550 [Pseudoalteromonas sp. CO325X]|uniref:hypothetical protein n=1 Tax=Pseudoalteromonas sp. CO325X TaxID=1777262 RepID=UPI001023A5CF|nr:hypothetical protein [Pseudoalteromonas sp. CO325X]RZF81820.1 hypothetical protein EXT46_08550 [Pseudoalteromonas sp. CO325X]
MSRDVDTFYFYASVFLFFVVVGLTWFMLALGFELSAVQFNYPASGLSLVVFEPLFPLIPISWAITIFAFVVGIFVSMNEIWQDNKHIKLALNRLGKASVAFFVLILVVVSANYVAWPIRASHSGYQSCPDFTLLHNESLATAWVTDIEICHNDKVDTVLKNSLHKNVLRANELIESQHQ